MTARVRVTPEAEADINETYVWYEQARAGLGDTFLEALQETVSQVAEHPTAFRVAHEGIRRALLPRFPYVVFYIQEQRDVVVLACLHARRNPTAWKIRGRLYGDA